jgi:hypothetical protein
MAVLHVYWEEDGKERSARERDMRGKRGRAVSWRPGASESLLGLKAASRRWHAGGPAQDTQQLAAYWKKKAVFAENPLGFERFQEKIETAHFAIFCTLNGVQKF